MSCLESLIRKYWPSLFENENKEIKNLKQQIDEKDQIIDAKNRMGDHLENTIKLQRANYDDLSSRYQRAILKLSEYIEKYEREEGDQAKEEDDGKIAGNP